MFSSRQKTEEPFWSVKRQKAYKISRIIWIAQIAIALLASAGLIVFILVK
jgi:hypothetical protein